MEGVWLISYIVLWILVLGLGVLVIVLYRQLGIMYLGTAEGVSRDGLPRGAQAPDFTLTDQYGEVHRLSSYRGRPVALLFGSPHCNPCRTLLPQLQQWAHAHPDVATLCLNAASPEESLRFVSETGADLPVLPYRPEDKLMDKYKVRVTPFMFMVNEEGVIASKGLANTGAVVDIYYQEMKTGKVESSLVLLEQERELYEEPEEAPDRQKAVAQ